MSKVPALSYDKVINALRRDGWVVVRQRGSHIRLQKHTEDKTLKLIVPAHRPIKRSTLSHIIEQANLIPTKLTFTLAGVHLQNKRSILFYTQGLAGLHHFYLAACRFGKLFSVILPADDVAPMVRYSHLGLYEVGGLSRFLRVERVCAARRQ